jgi:regulator of cell morphogenesis and NO signaling
MTQTLNLNRTVGELVAERPGRARVFEEYGIDYCCGGQTPFEQACRERELDPDTIAAKLTQADSTQSPLDEPRWTTASLAELCDHIESKHHEFMHREMPRLEAMARKVVAAHGEKYPATKEVLHVFLALKAELDYHLMKEERILFPMIRQLEASTATPQFHCGSLSNPISVMEHEHDTAGDALRKLRELTNDYTPPPDACNTWRALLDGLQALEADLHQHIHKENNILFPRAMRLEAERGG